MRNKVQYVEIEIDKLTDSIENVRTGDRFLTDILLVDKVDIRAISKANGWLFDWKSEFLKEPLDVDFYMDPKSLTATEEKMISDYIKADKEKNKNLHPSKKKARTNTITQE